MSIIFIRAQILLFVLTLLSCGSENRYTIMGKCDAPMNGDTVVLAYSKDGIEIHEIDECVVNDGYFRFDGCITGCKLCYIYNISGEKLFVFPLFLEEGEIDVFLSYRDGFAVGTPCNDAYKSFSDSIDFYISIIDGIESETLHHSFDNADNDAARLDGLKEQLRLEKYIRKVVNENMENLLGLYLLVLYNEFFDNEELHCLLDKMSVSFIDRKNNLLYDILVDIDSYRNCVHK